METAGTTTRKKQSIGELVANDWRNAEVFKKYGIDFCCGGKKTVEEACAQSAIDPSFVESELKKLEETAVAGTQDFKNWELDFLIDYIVNNHHKYVVEAIPFLEELSLKVVRVHGNSHSELIEIDSQIRQLTDELSMHMHKEELILFPYIKQLVGARRNGQTLGPPPFGTIANPISMMEIEHVAAGGAMEAIEELSNHFNPPADACTSYRVLFAKLQEFQMDLHQHVHLENNILFPKALKLEEESTKFLK